MSQSNITRTTVPHSKDPFSKDSDLLNNLNLQNYSHVEIAESSKVYGLLTAYVLKICTSPANSLAVDIGQAKDITSKAFVLASLKQKKAIDCSEHTWSRDVYVPARQPNASMSPSTYRCPGWNKLWT